jgi:hypothetical protein
MEEAAEESTPLGHFAHADAYIFLKIALSLDARDLFSLSCTSKTIAHTFRDVLRDDEMLLAKAEGGRRILRRPGMLLPGSPSASAAAPEPSSTAPLLDYFLFRSFLTKGSRPGEVRRV